MWYSRVEAVSASGSQHRTISAISHRIARSVSNIGVDQVREVPNRRGFRLADLSQPALARSAFGTAV
jgi:hypothetical protein